MNYASLLKNIPAPTSEQYKAFAEHVRCAHSWYKHLPLLTGGEFVFFLAADAGQGFSDEQPRLHYSWKTTREYRRRFGCLDYMWRVEAQEPFNRDTIGLPWLPQELAERFCIQLHPYMSCDGSPQEVPLYDRHMEAFRQLRGGSGFAVRDTLLEWHDSALMLEEIWQNKLTLEEREGLCSDDLAVSDYMRVSPALASYAEWRQKNTVAYNTLQEHEISKIQNCLERLRQWRDEEQGKA